MSLEEVVYKAKEELINISEYMRLNKLSQNHQKAGYLMPAPYSRTNSVE